jgi:hypothetical protein
MIALDTRIGDGSNGAMIWSGSAGERVLRISDNRNGRERLYAASAAGRVVVWEAATNSTETAFNLRTQIDCFDVHSALPIIAYSKAKEPPVVCAMNGTPLCTAKAIECASVFAFHPILPIITFGLPNGNLMLHDILISPEQK